MLGWGGSNNVVLFPLAYSGLLRFPGNLVLNVNIKGIKNVYIDF
jgi:hypothetical protein